MVYAFMPGSNQVDIQLSLREGQRTAGIAIGVLALETWFPYVPGHLYNASTYSFPVIIKVMENTHTPEAIGGDRALGNRLIEAGRELEQFGIRAVVGGCGFFANYQKEVSAALNVPAFMSSLLQLPLVSRAIKPNQKVGILTASAPTLGLDTLKQCGVESMSNLAIYGIEGLPEFQNILKDTGKMNSHKLEQEIVSVAKQMVSEHPEVGAILLECADMPPYSWAIQNATKLPVFDWTTLINWVSNAVVRRPFPGFI